MQRKQLAATIIGSIGLAAAIAYAANRNGVSPIVESSARSGSSIVASRSQPEAGTALSQGVVGHAGNPTASASEISDATLGDADSFGRNVRWLGLTTAIVYTVTDCGFILAGDPNALCQQIPNLAATTSFAFKDIARIQLPAKASNSLLCHWFSPRVDVDFVNPTAAPVPGRFSYNPTLTLENPVLDDPSLIDPTTGVPFGGKLTTGMAAAEFVQVVVEPTFPISQSLRDSVICQDGLISKRALMKSYGLTESQATKFFLKPTMVRLNVSGASRFVDFASLSLGLRIVGD